MSTAVTLQTDCASLQQSLDLAAAIGARLRGREVIELVSDLGGGKTSFTRGLARGIGSTDHVSSPTFTLANTYASPKLTMHHFDFYRLTEPGIMREELSEVLADEQGVVVVEWADIVADVLPADRLTISLSVSGETSRHVSLSASPALGYLLEGLPTC